MELTWQSFQSEGSVRISILQVLTLPHQPLGWRHGARDLVTGGLLGPSRHGPPGALIFTLKQCLRLPLAEEKCRPQVLSQSQLLPGARLLAKPGVP